VMVAAGVVLTPENRKEEGLVMGLSTRANFFLASLRGMARRGISSVRRERLAAAELVRKLEIKVADVEAPCIRSVAATSKRSWWGNGSTPGRA